MVAILFIDGEEQNLDSCPDRVRGKTVQVEVSASFAGDVFTPTWYSEDYVQQRNRSFTS